MSTLFNTILFHPILNALIFIYNILPFNDFGVAIIILTVAVRLILSPLSIKAIRSQRAMSKLQPKIKEINEKFKNDKQAIARATMELYKEYGVNPFSGCLPLLIQLPILLALYKAFSSGLNPEGIFGLYSFITNPGVINTVFLKFVDLTGHSPLLAITAGVLQWFQSRLAMKNMPTTPSSSGKSGSSEIATAMMGKQMLYFMPVMIIIIAWGLPAGLAIYWVTTTIYAIFEQLYINKKYPLQTN
jgi:YidC/Oxa1 family membrane protein insertase